MQFGDLGFQDHDKQDKPRLDPWWSNYQALMQQLWDQEILKSHMTVISNWSKDVGKKK